jgi:hypothetical protein
MRWIFFLALLVSLANFNLFARQVSSDPTSRRVEFGTYSLAAIAFQSFPRRIV